MRVKKMIHREAVYNVFYDWLAGGWDILSIETDTGKKVTLNSELLSQANQEIYSVYRYREYNGRLN